MSADYFITNNIRLKGICSKEDIEVIIIEKRNLSEYELAPDFLDMFNIFESDKLGELYYYKEQDNLHKKLL